MGAGLAILTSGDGGGDVDLGDSERCKERSWSESQGRIKPLFLEPQSGHFIPLPSLHPYLADVSAISSLSTLPIPSAGPPCSLPALSWADS